MRKIALLTVALLVFVPAVSSAQSNDDDYFLGLLDGKPPRDLDKKLANAAQYR